LNLICFFDCLQIWEIGRAARHVRRRWRRMARMIVETLAHEAWKTSQSVGRVFAAFERLGCTPGSLAQEGPVLHGRTGRRRAPEAGGSDVASKASAALPRRRST